MTKNWMHIQTIESEKQIPQHAEVGQVYEVRRNGIYYSSWKVCKNWMGYVFAATCDTYGMVWGEREIVLRIEDGKDTTYLS